MCSRLQLRLGDELLLRRDRHVLDLQGGENRRVGEGQGPSWSAALATAAAGVTNPCAPSVSHPSLSSCVTAALSAPATMLAPHLRLLEELAALLILDVGDLTILYLGTRPAVRLR